MTAFLDPRALLVGLLLLIGAAAGGYLKGHHDADQSAEIEALELRVKDADERARMADASKAEAIRQAEAARDIAIRATDRERAAIAAADSRKVLLDDYVRSLSEAEAKAAAAGHCNCSLSDDDVRRLRGIVGPATPRGAPANPSGSPVELRRAGPAP